MVIDSSALVAILLGEPEADQLVHAIVSDGSRLVGTPTLVEASAVMLARKGTVGEVALDALLQRLAIDVVPISIEAAARARDAYRHYGKGTGSPRVLNFGDRLSYGIATAAGEPLLFKGEHFAPTDMQMATY